MDNVNHPKHYNMGKFETIEIIEDITGDGFESYLLGNIIKYLARYKYKMELRIYAKPDGILIS